MAEEQGEVMSLPELFKFCTENSLGVLLAIIIAYMFYRVLMHILSQQKDILKMATEQNVHWQAVISEHTNNAKTFHEEVKEAHKCQRIEHEKMLTHLDLLNQQSRLTVEALGRINGYS